MKSIRVMRHKLRPGREVAIQRHKVLMLVSAVVELVTVRGIVKVRGPVGGGISPVNPSPVIGVECSWLKLPMMGSCGMIV